ncbi:MAG TPA: hypothetical protein VL403_13620 [Candidatus Kryptonia bacterium]|nr:hypothetical protein [Candidatus Kryptonia bacterium]
MSKRILLGGCDIPGWGGAATCQYHLTERMQRDGLDVASVYLINEIDQGFYRYVWGDNFLNPRSLENIHACVLAEPLYRVHERVTDLIDTLAPDLLVAFGVIATVIMKLAAPRLPIVFMTIGSYHVQRLIETGAVEDFMDFQRLVARGVRFPVAADSPERQAVQLADLIVMHSPVVRFAFDHFFPGSVGKAYENLISFADFIYPDSQQVDALRRPFAERDIDLLFAASSWTRPIKNYPLVEQIVAQCDGLNVHIAGDCERRHPAVHHHGVVTSRAELYALLGRSKTLVCPSLVDAAPGILFEASALGCNVVASPNCGNWPLCSDELVAKRCTRNEFVAKIHTALAAPQPDNRNRFLGGYDDLVATLYVF